MPRHERQGVRGGKVARESAIDYNSRNHCAIICQTHGSVWPKTLKFCLFNVFLTLWGHFYLHAKLNDLGFVMSGKGHALMAIVVSFLVVTRVNMALAQYKEARSNLSGMLTTTRDLVAATAIHTKDDKTQGAKEWRNLVAYYSCLLLRLTMAALDYNSEGTKPWSIPELHADIKELLLKHNQITGVSSKWAHAKRTEREEVYRVPYTMSNHLRIALTDHKKYLESDICTGLAIGRFNGIVDRFISAYSSQLQQWTTPSPPFPMIQMSRTIVFIWVFLLPFALVTDDSSVIAQCVIVFFVTFAFIGLEMVAIEADDPFGHDENDFDNMGMTVSVFEDVYNMIDIIDGPEWAYKVRFNMKSGEDDEFFRVRPLEATPLIGV